MCYIHYLSFLIFIIYFFPTNPVILLFQFLNSRCHITSLYLCDFWYPEPSTPIVCGVKTSCNGGNVYAFPRSSSYWGHIGHLPCPSCWDRCFSSPGLGWFGWVVWPYLIANLFVCYCPPYGFSSGWRCLSVWMQRWTSRFSGQWRCLFWPLSTYWWWCIWWDLACCLCSFCVCQFIGP